MKSAIDMLSVHYCAVLMKISFDTLSIASLFLIGLLQL